STPATSTRRSSQSLDPASDLTGTNSSMSPLMRHGRRYDKPNWAVRTWGSRRIKQRRYAFSIVKACTEPDRSKRNRSNSYLRCKSVDQPLRCRTRRRLDSPDRLQRIQRILHAMDIQLEEPSCL